MIKASFVTTLVRAAHAAPSADNTQPWHFSWDGRQLAVRYDAARVAGKTFPCDNPATLLSIGAAIESLLVAAAQLGFTVDLDWWPRGPDAGDHYASLSLSPGDSRDSSGPNPGDARREGGAALSPAQRHTNRFAYRKTPLPDELLQYLASLSEGRARLVTVREPEGIRGLGSLVRQASEIRFQTREVHEWLGASLRFSRESV
ncbi:MAG: hypothetical protein ACK5HY_17095, partial [Parahaliea sp.]